MKDVPEHLRDMVRSLGRAYPDGVAGEERMALLVALADEMSERNIGDLMWAWADEEPVVAQNDLAAALSGKRPAPSLVTEARKRVWGDLRGLMPQLERPREAATVGDETAARLVAFALAPDWSDHWASCALDWVDSGVWSDEIEWRLRAVSQDMKYSQRTRHRAWRYVKPNQGNAG